MEEAQALANRLYRAFDGMGTDEDEVSAVLKIARDKGMMREVDALYRKTYPDELDLRASLDDELSGEELESAVRLYDEGMKQAPKQQAAATANPVHGTLTPRPTPPPDPSDTMEFELEVPTPAEREELRRKGINLPVASADPKQHGDYVENRLEAVGFGIYLGGYMLYFTGMDIPVFVPERHFDFSNPKMTAVDPAIFPDYDSASRYVQSAPAPSTGAKAYAYYWGAGGAVIAPTLFTPETAPQVIKTALEARRQLAKYVQDQLTSVAIGIVAGMVIRAVVGWIVRISGGKGVKPPPKLSNQALKARDLAKQIKAKGDPVVANMGGAGASHEPQGAININNQAVARKGIPNHVDADASDVGLLFDKGTLDQVVGHHMPPGVINWGRAVPGIRNALKPGGTFRFDWRGANEEAAQVAKMLTDAGFKDVKNMANAVVTATKPL